MERLKVLGIKYIVASIVTFSLYGMFDQTSIGRLFLIGLLVVIIPYLGDLYLLPIIGNLYASISDFGLYFLLYWVLASSFIGVSSPVLFASLAAAFFTAISESLLHVYILERIFNQDQKSRNYP